MAKKNTPEVKTEQKVQTKYERKMEARRLKEAKDKRDEKIFKITSTVVGLVLVVGIIAGIAFSVISKQNALNETYVKVGEEEVTQLEFDYYVNITTNNYLTTYASILPYFGLDTTQDFDKQYYTETLTWQDMFEQMAVEQMSQTFALVADANASGFTYDVEADYESRMASVEEAANAAGVSVSEYCKSIYGEYATVNNVAPFIKEGLLAAAYYNELLANNTPSAEEISTYYEEHKQDYDKVDYRSFTFATELAEDAAEEDIAATMEQAKEKADAFVMARQSGSDFETLCASNASEEEKANYEDDETEYSLIEGAYSSGVPYVALEWLYDDARVEGDITVLEDETNHCYYVVEFVKKYYDEADDANISDLIASNRVTEYVAALIENYQVVDENGKLDYLKALAVEEESTESAIESETEESDATEETEIRETTEETTEVTETDEAADGCC